MLDIFDVEEAAGAFRGVLDDLRRHLAVGYYPEPAHGDGRWRDIEIEAKGVRGRLRHASGYFDSGGSP